SSRHSNNRCNSKVPAQDKNKSKGQPVNWLALLFLFFLFSLIKRLGLWMAFCIYVRPRSRVFAGLNLRIISLADQFLKVIINIIIIEHFVHTEHMPQYLDL